MYTSFIPVDEETTVVTAELRQRTCTKCKRKKPNESCKAIPAKTSFLNDRWDRVSLIDDCIADFKDNNHSFAF